jgi:DNA-binding response OmpR family regulator
MDAALGSLPGLAPVSDPSVLIIESHPTFVKILPELQHYMPNIVFDVCTSHEDRLSTLRQGRYHTLITDTALVHANQCSILKEALSAPCPVPVLISAKAGEIGAVIPALDEGVLDIIADPPSGRQASLTIRQALWLYRLRLTMRLRRERLKALLERRAGRSAAISSRGASVLLEQTIRDIQQTNVVFDRTIQHIERSLRVLEDSSHRLESQARESAMRKVRLLAPPPVNGDRGGVASPRSLALRIESPPVL